MKTYKVTPELAGFSGKPRLWSVLLTAGLFAVMGILLQLLGSFPNLPNNLSGAFLDAIGTGIIVGLLSAFFYNESLKYSLVITDESFTAIYPLFKRSIKKNEVRTISETRGSALAGLGPGLRISKHGRFGTGLWGAIWIPTGLPDYDSLKELALSWKAHDQPRTFGANPR